MSFRSVCLLSLVVSALLTLPTVATADITVAVTTPAPAKPPVVVNVPPGTVVAGTVNGIWGYDTFPPTVTVYVYDPNNVCIMTSTVTVTYVGYFSSSGSWTTTGVPFATPPVPGIYVILVYPNPPVGSTLTYANFGASQFQVVAPTSTGPGGP